MLARILTVSTLLACAAQAVAQCPRARLQGSAPHENFGRAAALDGGHVLVGARLFDADTGDELLELVPPGGASQFGASVDLDGELAVVGAVGGTGSLFLFEVPSGVPRGKLKVAGLDPSDGFGGNVAVDGVRVVAGAAHRDVVDIDSGSAWVFELRAPDAPLELVPSQGNASSRFGISVAIEGERVVVGAPGDDVSGAVYVFDAATGVQLQCLIPSGPVIGFGSTLSVDSGRVLVGCDLAKRIFVFDLATGLELATIETPNGGIRSVALEGACGVVAPNSVELLWVVDFVSNQIVAEIHPKANEWVGFGRSLDLDGDRIIAGGPYWKWNEKGGAAFLIDLCDPLGDDYCGPAVPNSSGQSARIEAYGSLFAADDYAFVVADRMPVERTGYFLASEMQGFVIGPGGSDGNLCLGGKIVRFANQVRKTGQDGSFQLRVDLDDVGVMAGETWNFQAWFRDHVPGKSNFTDSVSVLFL